MGEVYDEELEQIKMRKLEEYKKRLEALAREEEARRAEEAKKQEILRHILTPEARQRLTNLKMVKPELAENIENQLIQLANMGRLNIPITDEQLKRMLESIVRHSRREIKIRYSMDV